MHTGYLLISLAYALFGLAIVRVEYRRTRRAGADVSTMFIVFFLLQCCLPGVVIYAALPFIDPAAPTGSWVADRILRGSSSTTALTVLCLAVGFSLFFYVGSAIGQVAFSRFGGSTSTRYALTLFHGRLLVLLLGGLVVSLWSFQLLGDNFTSRYADLVLLRADFVGIERTFLNVTALALTQTWTWLTVVALLAVYELKGRGWSWRGYLALLVIFALLGASRRALFLPLLLSYLALGLHSGKWRWRWVALGSVLLVLLVAFHGDILEALAFGRAVSGPTTLEGWASAMLRATSEIGITLVESLGTLTFIHLPPRLGVDHLLSIAQRVPEGMFGVEIDWPERIVRTSTAALVASDAQDMPPGLFGQMWLDFGPFGPVVWGLAFGLQMSVLQFVFQRTRRTLASAAIFVLLTFVVALPLNSGSFDFTFSIDIFLLVAVLWWCTRLSRIPRPLPTTL